MAEVPSKGISTSIVNLEPIHAGSEEDEDFEIPRHPRSHRTKGPAVVTVEKLLKEVIERQTTGDESVSAPMPAKIASSGSLQSQRKVLILKTLSRVPRLR